MVWSRGRTGPGCSTCSQRRGVERHRRVSKVERDPDPRTNTGKPCASSVAWSHTSSCERLLFTASLPQERALAASPRPHARTERRPSARRTCSQRRAVKRRRSHRGATTIRTPHVRDCPGARTALVGSTHAAASFHSPVDTRARGALPHRLSPTTPLVPLAEPKAAAVQHQLVRVFVHRLAAHRVFGAEGAPRLFIAGGVKRRRSQLSSERRGRHACS